MPFVMVSVLVARFSKPSLRCTGCRAVRRRSASASDWPMPYAIHCEFIEKLAPAAERHGLRRRAADLGDAQLAVAADLGDRVGEPLPVRRQAAECRSGRHRLELVVVRRLQRRLRLRGRFNREGQGKQEGGGQQDNRTSHGGTSEHPKRIRRKGRIARVGRGVTRRGLRGPARRSLRARGRGPGPRHSHRAASGRRTIPSGSTRCRSGPPKSASPRHSTPPRVRWDLQKCPRHTRARPEAVG